jgi:hypothetical protein
VARKNDKILQAARERFDTSSVAEYENRKVHLNSTKFNDGQQWDEKDKQKRIKNKRPVITNNLLRKNISQLSGEIRQNIPSIKVRPKKPMAKNNATILQDIIRDIEYNSRADKVYVNALEQALNGGIGYFRIVTEFSDNDSFDQDIRIKKIANRHAVYLDQSSDEETYEDARYGFISDWISKEEFKRLYPRKVPADFEAASFGEQYKNWFEKDRLRIVEYFWKQHYLKEIALLSTGQVIEVKNNKIVDKIELLEDPVSGGVVTIDPGTPISQLADYGLEVSRTRKVKSHKVMWAKLTGHQIVEGPQEFPSSNIPIIPVIGFEMNIEGKRMFRGVNYDAEDSQRVYNYFLSSITEKIGMLPKSPYIAAYDQVASYVNDWQRANEDNIAVLYYDPIPDAPPPQRVQREDVPVGSMNIMDRMKQDVRDTTGRYAAALGQQSNERSGVAIRERKSSSDTTTYTFFDNLIGSLIHSGKIIVEMIQKTYDTERIFRVIGKDGREEWLSINQEYTDPATGLRIITNDVSVGEYDVVIETGAMYNTKRQEAIAGLERLIQFVPAITPVVIDLLAELSDWPKAHEIKQRVEEFIQQQAQQQQPPAKGAQTT